MDKKRTFWETLYNEFTSKMSSGSVQIREDMDGLKYGGMSIKEVRKRLDEIEAKYGDKYEDILLEVDSDYEPYSNEPTISITFKGFREETDEEYDERMAVVKAYNEVVKARELEQLEKLKAKYES